MPTCEFARSCAVALTVAGMGLALVVLSPARMEHMHRLGQVASYWLTSANTTTHAAYSESASTSGSDDGTPHHGSVGTAGAILQKKGLAVIVHTHPGSDSEPEAGRRPSLPVPTPDTRVGALPETETYQFSRQDFICSTSSGLAGMVGMCRYIGGLGLWVDSRACVCTTCLYTCMRALA